MTSDDTTVSSNSRITIGLLVAVIALLAPAVWLIVTLNFKVNSIQSDMRSVWTVQDQALWQMSLQQNNPTMTLKFSDPYEINKKRKESQQ